jgi:hypothetical protein
MGEKPPSSIAIELKVLPGTVFLVPYLCFDAELSFDPLEGGD